MSFKEKLNSKYNFNFKKRFGQNFIKDSNIISAMIRKLDIDKDTLVIEIGPGSGALSKKLAELAKNVLCYEIDTSLKEVLNDNLKEFDNIDIIFEDFLKADVSNDIKKYEYKKKYLVANLPYYITTPIIEKVIKSKIKFDLISIMVQKEVGDRLTSQVGSKDYGSLTVYLNYYYDIKKIISVPRTVFVPQPNVDSVVISLIPHNLYNTNEERFSKLVKDAFKQKRKTLGNNLKNYNLDKIAGVLKLYGYDLRVRAEELPVEVYVEITDVLGEDNV